MSKSVQYITNEQGERVGVLLEWQEYQRLASHHRLDPELLTDLSQDELHVLANSMLVATTQARLDELLAKYTESVLSNSEQEELDQLLTQVDLLNVLKTRARYTLASQSVAK